MESSSCELLWSRGTDSVKRLSAVAVFNWIPFITIKNDLLDASLNVYIFFLIISLHPHLTLRCPFFELFCFTLYNLIYVYTWSFWWQFLITIFSYNPSFFVFTAIFIILHNYSILNLKLSQKLNLKLSVSSFFLLQTSQKLRSNCFNVFLETN